jgi:hypothetical protein
MKEDEIMREFNLNNGTCWIALSYAMDEAKAMGLKTNTQAYFDYIAVRKYEIWEQLESKTYKFSTADRL